MQALSKKVKLADDVDFQVIAAETEGFSGADLQSLVSTAQLSSLEHLLHSEEKVQFLALLGIPTSNVSMSYSYYIEDGCKSFFKNIYVHFKQKDLLPSFIIQFAVFLNESFYWPK